MEGQPEPERHETQPDRLNEHPHEGEQDQVESLTGKLFSG